MTGSERPIGQYVFAPARPAVGGFEKRVLFEARQVDGDVWALPVFTSLDILVARLGSSQPWIKINLEHLRDLMGRARSSILIDPLVHQDAVRWSESDLTAYMEGGR